MTSKLKVNIIADGGDNAIMTSNGSGTLTLNNAALKMTPAFEANLGSDQTVSDNTFTKLNINTEVFDTDSKYFDASSNPENPRWIMVDLEAVKPLKTIINSGLTQSDVVRDLYLNKWNQDINKVFDYYKY